MYGSISVNFYIVGLLPRMARGKKRSRNCERTRQKRKSRITKQSGTLSRYLSNSLFRKKTTRRSRISATAERPIAAIYFRLDLFGFCSRLLALRNGEYLTINTPPPLISRRSTREKVFSEILRRTGEKNSRNIRLALDVRYIFFEYGANDNSFVVIP